MKQDWEIYRDTGILGAAMAEKNWMNSLRKKNSSRPWEDSKNGKHQAIGRAAI